jgi:hypothetical protein
MSITMEKTLQKTGLMTFAKGVDSYLNNFVNACEKKGIALGPDAVSYFVCSIRGVERKIAINEITPNSWMISSLEKPTNLIGKGINPELLFAVHILENGTKDPFVAICTDIDVMTMIYEATTHKSSILTMAVYSAEGQLLAEIDNRPNTQTAMKKTPLPTVKLSPHHFSMLLGIQSDTELHIPKDDEIFAAFPTKLKEMVLSLITSKQHRLKILKTFGIRMRQPPQQQITTTTTTTNMSVDQNFVSENSGPLCLVCQKTAKFICGRCRAVYFCSKKCQIQDSLGLPTHKHKCI